MKKKFLLYALLGSMSFGFVLFTQLNIAQAAQCPQGTNIIWAHWDWPSDGSKMTIQGRIGTITADEAGQYSWTWTYSNGSDMGVGNNAWFQIYSGTIPSMSGGEMVAILGTAQKQVTGGKIAQSVRIQLSSSDMGKSNTVNGTCGFIASTAGSGDTAGSGSGGTATTNTTVNATQLVNPLPVNNIPDLVLNLLKYLLGVVSLAAVFMVVVGGFRMVMSNGNEKTFGAAKQTVTYAVIGLVISILAYSIIAIIKEALTRSF